ncbi:MAG TPA: hypothetical protein PKW41_02530 [Clostridia bacterium]|nr:hypothetical protein [Clostridia bacterium]HPK14845.1 hypothetical protein [Clostridia bacterium]
MMGIFRAGVDAGNGRGLKKLFGLFLQYPFELVCLNLFFVIGCIPTVTSPLAVVAMTQTMINLCEDVGSKPLRSYWKTFFHPDLRSFLTVLALVVLEILLCYGLAIYLGARNVGWLFWMGCGVNAAALAALTMAGFYICPLLLLTDMKPKQIWKNAFLLAFAKIPYSAAALAAIVLIWALCLRFFQQAWVAFILIIFSYSFLISVFCSGHWVRTCFGRQSRIGEEDSPCIG